MALDQISAALPAAELTVDVIDRPVAITDIDEIAGAGQRCAHCEMALRHHPDPDPDDPETRAWWSGYDPEGDCRTLNCFGVTAQTYPCPLCHGSLVDEDGYACETCDEHGVVADHQPAGGQDTEPDLADTRNGEPRPQPIAPARDAGRLDRTEPIREQDDWTVHADGQAITTETAATSAKQAHPWANQHLRKGSSWLSSRIDAFQTWYRMS